MVIDSHTHVGAVTVEQSYIGEADRDWADPSDLEVDYDERTAVMDENGIDEAIVSPTATYDRSEGIESTRCVNDSVREIVDEYDAFAAGVGTVEPTHGDRAIEELERIADLGLAGVGWHHRLTGTVIDSPTTIEVIERLDDLGLVAMIHAISPLSDLEHLDRIENVAGHTDQPIVVQDAMYQLGNPKKIATLGNRYATSTSTPPCWPPPAE
jgi:predicted TIM-barrel fold metal-dependent hydrolase